jgi:HK97 gp10 family phage protein
MMATIIGLDSLMRKLNALGGNSTQALTKGMYKSTALVEGDAKDLCAVDKGQTRNSIHSEVKVTFNEVKGSTGTNVEQAPYLEFGTGQRGAESPSPPKYDGQLGYREDWAGMPAQPFLYPAIQQNIDNIKEIMADELKKEIRRLGG